MSKTWKKMLALLLATIMATLSLTACASQGQQPSTNEQNNDVASGGPATGTEDPYASWPEKPITLVVPFGAGGEADLMGRLCAQYLNKEFGWEVVVQNIAGSSGTIGAAEVYNADPDGYTIMALSLEVMYANYITGKTDVDPTEFELFGNLCFDPQMLCTSASSPYTNLEELVTAAKKNPKAISWASVGANGYNQILYQLFCNAAGIDCVYVPYDSSAESKTSVLGGHEDALWGLVGGFRSSVNSGELYGIAVGKEDRTPLLPDVPTFKELGYDLVMGLHRCHQCPPGTPQEIVDKLDNAFKTIFENPEFQEAMTNDIGFELMYMNGSELNDFADDCYAQFNDAYQKMVESSN